ncbi:hypothetical protein FQ087_21055 [Sporosarcina sp. ANT_H38]|uniref:hypothetical protein n=1 Tax=Sporosarcina sp. ANT_H38 TaxID=2597358 RepID=UPI0011F0A654|nr:hypothetical protein [Sporosarcina sp. ANT_H38]KAA0941644.1 hypothetical protein FQ087_21055 [Sporosarcina sp. ANT_H38]
MMKNLKTVDQARKEIKILQGFINLVESIQPQTLEEQIIKEYAYIGSVEKVAIKVSELGYLKSDGQPFEKEDISNIIKGKPTNDLHKLIKTGFLKKTRHTRRKIEKYSW